MYTVNCPNWKECDNYGKVYCSLCPRNTYYKPRDYFKPIAKEPHNIEQLYEEVAKCLK